MCFSRLDTIGLPTSHIKIPDMNSGFILDSSSLLLCTLRGSKHWLPATHSEGLDCILRFWLQFESALVGPNRKWASRWSISPSLLPSIYEFHIKWNIYIFKTQHFTSFLQDLVEGSQKNIFSHEPINNYLYACFFICHVNLIPQRFGVSSCSITCNYRHPSTEYK